MRPGGGEGGVMGHRGMAGGALDGHVDCVSQLAKLVRTYRYAYVHVLKGQSTAGAVR